MSEKTAFDILADLIEDPQNNGNYRLNISGEDLRRLWNATEAEKAQLNQWREVARNLAENIRAHDIDRFGPKAGEFKSPALAAYDDLNKKL